jgi:multisubunit Na+/H+ antiporter MnhG subunit
MNTEPHSSGTPILNTALTGVTAVYLATDSFEVAALAAALAALFVLLTTPTHRRKHE